MTIEQECLLTVTVPVSVTVTVTVTVTFISSSESGKDLSLSLRLGPGVTVRLTRSSTEAVAQLMKPAHEAYHFKFSYGLPYQ